MKPFETFEVDGLTVELHYDDDASYANPRECDGNVGTMVCWHPDYVLGDEQIRDGSGRGAVETEHERSGRFKSIGMLARWASLAERAPVVLPLYLYDHSGITMRAGAGLVVGETPSGGRDEFGSPRGWDTTLCGVIYTTPERWMKWMGQSIDAEAPGAVEEALRGEVAYYAAYLEGRVYGYVVKDANGDELDSCWGFLADVDNRDDDAAPARYEGTESAKVWAKSAREKTAQVARAWASLYQSRGFPAVAS